jgi:hypothetical protein
MSEKTISLIPGGTIQFYDFKFSSDQLGRPELKFFEYATNSNDNATQTSKLKILKKDKSEDVYIDCQTGQVFVNPINNTVFNDYDELFSYSIEKIMDVYLDKWVPLPFFRKSDDISYTEQRNRFGPTDWCRVYLTQDKITKEYNGVIAFDTSIEVNIELSQINADQGYPAICEQDVFEQGSFRFVSDIKKNNWYLNLYWIQDWLKDLKYSPKLYQSSKSDNYKTDHFALYLSFLELLKQTQCIPNVKLINTNRNQAINVDLVIDIGNSRTIGMLVEDREDNNQDLSNGSQLEIRNLTNPCEIYKETFSSYVTFSETFFGDKSKNSLGSGRLIKSFTWPSVVRLGKEANWLSTFSRREEGQTSLSSPKRYLWDLKPRNVGEEWRYVPDPKDIHSPEIPVNRGNFVGYINNAGYPLEQSKNVKSRKIKLIKNHDIFPATEPRFSRSSMMMFLLSEIISHALVQINSPIKRSERQNSDIPRHLNNIILTTPPAMSVTEKNLFEAWANWAVDVTWKALEWENISQNTNDYRKKPKIKFNLDEATATQFVFLFNEIDVKFSGEAKEFFSIYGKTRNKYGLQPSLRIASIDIGGGTTDMVITTFSNESRSVTNIVVPHQEFRESFNFAGDDIIKSIIEHHIIKSICALSKSSTNQYLFKIQNLFKDTIDVSEKEKGLRLQFTQQFLIPIALNILQSLEKLDIVNIEKSNIEINFDDLFKNKYPDKHVMDYFASVFKNSIDPDFKLAGQTIIISAEEIVNTINASISAYLEDLTEIVELYDCDFLLLSGRPSCLPNIQSIIIKRSPVMPGRFIPMNKYRIENWYPFATPAGLIGDPKTTGVVGALLATKSETNLRNFHIRLTNLKPASTIRFIGPMRVNKQIKNEDLYFEGKDVQKAESLELRHKDKENGTKFYIGFRQFNSERWKTTPFYYISQSKDPNAALRSERHGLPYEYEFSYSFDDTRDEIPPTAEYEKEGILEITNISAADGTNIPLTDINIEFKSIWEESHWLDTGIFDLTSTME